MGNPDEWLETVRKCEYLPEHDIKKLCEMVKSLLLLFILILIIVITITSFANSPLRFFFPLESY